MGFRFGALTGSSERRRGTPLVLGVWLLASDGRAVLVKARPSVALMRHQKGPFGPFLFFLDVEFAQ